MTSTNSVIIIIVVIAIVVFLIYSQNKSKNVTDQITIQPFQNMGGYHHDHARGGFAEHRPYHPGHAGAVERGYEHPHDRFHERPVQATVVPVAPTAINVNVNNDDIDPYADAIKRQDIYSIYDPLTYPQGRLPRDVLMQYNEYFRKRGDYPPFNEVTQPLLFDNATMVGVLIKKVCENEPFDDNVPSAVPLFKVKSMRNSNRFFYYIIYQGGVSRLEPKIPLDNVRVNGVCYRDAKDNGLPELYDGDVLEDVSVFPYTKFCVNLYRVYTFP